MTNSTTISTPVTTRGTGSGSSAAPHKDTSMSPVVTSGLAATQLNANFGKVPGKQPHVIDLIKECYEFNGRGEISDDLCKVIDDLVGKAKAHCQQEPDEIKRIIVEIIKNPNPEPASAPTVSTALSALSPALASTPEPVATVPGALLAASKASTEPATQRKPLNVEGINKLVKKNVVVNALREVEAKYGVPEKLVQYKKDLESIKADELSQKVVIEDTKKIDELDDMDSFNKTLNEVADRVKKLAETVSNEKKAIVDVVRKADLTNRQQNNVIRTQQSAIEAFHSAGSSSSPSGESVEDSRDAAAKILQRWYRGTKYHQTMHQRAVQGYKMIQSRLDSATRNIVEPNKNNVELNKVELNALEKKLDALEIQEQEKLPQLQKNLNEIPDARNDENAHTFRDQVRSCEENINNVKEQKKKITALLRTVSAAETDLKLINNLTSKFVAAVPPTNANALPFSLPLLANGVDSPSVKYGYSLNKALEYGRTGKSTHALSRSAALKIYLSEFGSWFNDFEHKAKSSPETTRGNKLSFLAELGGSLRTPGGERSEKVLEYIGTADFGSPEGLDKNGRIFIHKLAAANVSAAGFNAKTLVLDAPSLAYKVESSYSRKSQEQVGTRLMVLSSLSRTLQSEVFKGGVPIDFTHTVITAQHAVEAASLILAAIPNDLLTTNYAEVTPFMKSLKDFEGKVELAEQQRDGKVTVNDLESFKQELSNFHKKAALWVAERDTLGAEQSVTAAREISKEIGENRRGGILRRISVNVGNFVNLAGGKAIRESFASIQNYFSTINQKERLRQQLVKTENIATVFELKKQLKPLLSSKDASNAQALTDYLDGKSLTVKLQGQLSPQLKRTLVELESFVQKLWKSCGNRKPQPKVIEWSSSIDQSPSKLLVGAANDQSIKVNRATSSAKTSSPIKPMSEIAIIDKLLLARGRKIQEVSGQGNRCWLRAANASAIAYSDVQDVSQRVFDALEKVKAEWLTKIQPDAKKAGMLVDSYEPYWPKNVDEVKNIYQALGEAKNVGYRIDDAQVETNLQKMTLQLAIPRLTDQVLGIVGTSRPIKNEGTTEANSLAKNLKELLGMAEVQGDRQIITAFFESIGSKVDFISDRDRVKDLDSKQGKNDTVLLKHTGSSVHSGHYRFYSKHN
jgi:hypothetical protein